MQKTNCAPIDRVALNTQIWEMYGKNIWKLIWFPPFHLSALTSCRHSFKGHFGCCRRIVRCSGENVNQNQDINLESESNRGLDPGSKDHIRNRNVLSLSFIICIYKMGILPAFFLKRCKGKNIS